MSKVAQYKLGVEAGKELKKFHQLAAPSDVLPWDVRKQEKHRRYMDAYNASGIRISNDHQIIQFIEENIHLMKARPTMFQHDDFHLGNIIVQEKKFAGIIDFDRYDWGDPIHEFLKIGIFSRGSSIPFSIGQIKGYFNNEEPDECFWRLYSLYLAMCVFSTVVWTINVLPNRMEEMLGKVYVFLEDHDYFKELKPKWYTAELTDWTKKR